MPNFKFKKPTLITLTAPTCSGKSFLLDHLSKEDPWITMHKQRRDPNYVFEPLVERIVSTTTRPKRTNEVEGIDYYFISREASEAMEKNGEFAELIDFRGTRYGVTKQEMNSKMMGAKPPVVILEPEGLKQYKKLCEENGWGIFTVYVETHEDDRVKRLIERTSMDIRNAVLDEISSFENEMMRNVGTLEIIEKEVLRHTDRLLSITGEERNWFYATDWDCVVSGVNMPAAIRDIEEKIAQRNHETD